MSETQQSEPTPDPVNTDEQVQAQAPPPVKEGPEVAIKRAVPTPPARMTKAFLIGENAAIQVWRMRGSNAMKITFDRLGASGAGVHTGLPHVDGINPLDVDIRALLEAMVAIQDRAAEDSHPQKREGLTHKLGGGLRRMHAEKVYEEVCGVDLKEPAHSEASAPKKAPKHKKKRKQQRQQQEEVRRMDAIPPPPPAPPVPEQPEPLVRRFAARMLNKLLG